jgi:hypothetical protein
VSAIHQDNGKIMTISSERKKEIMAQDVLFTFGVYEIPRDKAGATQRFRFGNHPVRQWELESEFNGRVGCVGIFLDRNLAEELAGILNAEE